MSSLREAAEAVPDSWGFTREGLAAYDEFRRLANPPTVLALLDVVEAVGGAWQEASPAGHWDELDAAMARLREALARLPEEVR